MEFSPTLLPPKCKILVIRLRSIGDVVLNTPVLESLKLNFPECRLAVLVEPPCDAVLRGNPFVDEIIVKGKNRASLGNFLSFLSAELKFFLDIRQKRFHIALDFHGGPRAANIAFLSGAKWKMGHRNSPRRWAYNLRITTPDFGEKVHTIKDQLSKLESLGLKIANGRPSIWVSDEEKEAMRQSLIEAGLGKEEPFAVIHPGVLKPHQRWQPEKMARIADHIQSKLGLKVVFSSTKEQVPQVEEITALMESKPLSMAGKTDLRQLIVLLCSAKFLVCHNGGQMHLGAAVGTPVFALFGPSTPKVFAPVGESHRIFYKDLPCSPCAPRPKFESCLKGEPECMAKIRAEEIIEEIDAFINETL